jgi:RecA-family ATPase
LVRQLAKRKPEALENMYFSNVTRAIKVNTEQGYESMRQVVELYEPDVVILDTIRDFHSADENNPTAVAETLDALKSIRGTKEISVGFIHHHSKSQGYERQQVERHMGSMRFVTPVDLAMSLTFDQKGLGYVILSFTKVRWAAAQQPVTLQRRDNWYDIVPGGV